MLLCYLRPRPETELLRVASQSEARPLLRGNSHLPEQLYQLCWPCEKVVSPKYLSASLCSIILCFMGYLVGSSGSHGVACTH